MPCHCVLSALLQLFIRHAQSDREAQAILHLTCQDGERLTSPSGAQASHPGHQRLIGARVARHSGTWQMNIGSSRCKGGSSLRREPMSMPKTWPIMLLASHVSLRSDSALSCEVPKGATRCGASSCSFSEYLRLQEQVKDPALLDVTFLRAPDPSFEQSAPDPSPTCRMLPHAAPLCYELVNSLLWAFTQPASQREISSIRAS